MKFSIITPTYNHAALITRTVRSLQAQDYTRDLIEWILIDGGSSDQTLETIQPEKFHPDLWESQPNRGFFDALNRGVEKATGDILCFLPAGDVLASRGTIYRLSCAYKNAGAACVYANLDVGTFQAETFSAQRAVRPGIYHRNLLARGWAPPLQTFSIERKVALQHVAEEGLFDLSYGEAAGYEWMMRLLGAASIEPAYLRIPTLQTEALLPKGSVAAEEQAIRTHQLGGPFTRFARRWRRY